MLDVLDWVKKHIDDTAALQKARPARIDAPPDQRVDPLTTLADLTGRLKAAGGAGHDAKARSAALASIQDTAALPVAALLAQYLGLGSAAATQAAREATWKSLVGFQLRLAQAMCASAGAQLTAASAVRALAACRVLAKLHLMHYATVPGRLWHVAYSLHASAEEAGFATTPVHAQSDPRTTTTAEQELLRLVMLHVSAPDMLAPEEIECADRVIERLGAEFTLRRPGVADNPFCFEPASELAPTRSKERQPAATTRHFGFGMGYESLERIGKQAGAANLEDFRSFGKDIAPRVQLSTVQHLLTFWRVDCPYALPAHEPASGTMHVVHGYGRIWQEISRAPGGKHELSLAATSPGVAQPAETWQLRGVGGGELAAEVPPESRSWLKCGEVIGLSVHDGAEHWMGMVRRIHARPDGRLQADISLMSRAPRAHTLRKVLRKGEDGVFTDAAAKQFGVSLVRALILADGAEPGRPANFMLPPESWAEECVFELQSDAGSRYLHGLQIVRRGDDYVRATFEWVKTPG
ncbi:MAG TPA: hypothetical protein VGX52_14285 [Burkholderiales bacterium]|nr:hypothetical protein [Burkholderiales bacterium]